MIFFVIFLILLIGIAQLYLTKDTLNLISEDIFPDEKIVEPGQTFHLIIHLENKSRRYLPFVRLKLLIPRSFQPMDTAHMKKDHFSDDYMFSCTRWLSPHQQLDIPIPVSLTGRGWYRLPGLEISTGDFLGIRESVRKAERYREVVAAPKIGQDEVPDVDAGSFLGEISVNRYLYEDPVLTMGFREYTGREPMKSIAWAQSARYGELMVRNYDHTTEPKVSVLLNAWSPLLTGPTALEEMCSRTRLVCRHLEDKGIPYSLQTNARLAGEWSGASGAIVHQGLGALHREHVLELLGRVTGQTACSAEDFVHDWTKGAAFPCSLILISGSDGLPDENCLKDLRQLTDDRLQVIVPES